MKGYVYFIRCQDRVKIGFSKDPHKRLTKINADAPYPCEFIGAADAALHPEEEVHRQFRSARVHSEWFSLTDEIARFVEKASVLKPLAGISKFDRADISAMPPLKAWRYRNRMTQQEAAAALGVTAGFLSRVESGDFKFSTEKLPNVSRVTGIPAEQLRPDLAKVFSQPEREAQ